MFVIPLCVHGPWALSLSLWTQGFAGGSLAYKFAVSHAHDDLRTEPTSKESYTESDAWITAQIEESMSWGGFVNTFIFGGIGRQIEHHIAPCLDPPMYHYVAPELERIARKYGIKYTVEPSFSRAVWQFHKKLWSMGWAQ
jgi:fatty acid desaturase